MYNLQLYYIYLPSPEVLLPLVPLLAVSTLRAEVEQKKGVFIINEFSYLISYNYYQELIELLKSLRGLCTPEEIEFIDSFILIIIIHER